MTIASTRATTAAAVVSNVTPAAPPPLSRPYRAASRMNSDIPRLDEPAAIVPFNENARGPARIGATLYQAPTPHHGFTATQRVVSTAAYPGPPDVDDFTMTSTVRRPMQVVTALTLYLLDHFTNIFSKFPKIFQNMVPNF